MGEFRLSPEAEAELDGIWIYIARESGNIDIATRVVEGITGGFWLLARYPYIGRPVTMICDSACAASPLTITSSDIASRRTTWC
jgi:plasmid stabilization system protein ParE